MADSPSNEKFYPGSQVAYIPTHANGNIDHQDVQFGFVTSDAGEKGVFVMYWNTASLATANPDLRTKSASELTPRDMLQRWYCVPAQLVDWAWEKYRGTDVPTSTVGDPYIEQLRNLQDKYEQLHPAPELQVVSRKVKAPAYVVADALVLIADKMRERDAFKQEDDWVGVTSDWDLNIVTEELRTGMWTVSAVLYPARHGQVDTSVWMQVFEMKITYKKDE